MVPVCIRQLEHVGRCVDVGVCLCVVRRENTCDVGDDVTGL